MNNLPTAVQQGISLLEMLIVLALITALSSLSYHTIVQYRYSQSLQNTSLQLMSFLIKVQSYADWHNHARIINILPLEDKHGWQVVAVLADESPTIVSQVSLVLADPLIEFIVYSQQSPVIFYGRRHMASAGHISLYNAGGEIRVIISARGRIRRCWQPAEPSSLISGGLPLC